MRNDSSTHWPSVITLWLCGIFAAMQFAKVSVAFAALQSHYAVSAAQMGWILSTVGMVGLLFGVTMGLLAPAIGYKRLLLGGMGLGVGLACLQSFMLPFPLFWATRVLEGASHLTVVVAAPTLMSACSAPQNRSVAMGLWSTFVGAAFAITGALGNAVIARWGVQAVFALHAAGLAAVWLLAFWVVPSDAQRAGARPVRPAWSALLAQHAKIYTHWATALPGLCFLCYTCMAVALLTFVPQQAGDDRVWLATVLPLLGVGGTFCAGWLAQYWLSPLTLTRSAFAAVGLSALALGLCLYVGWWVAPIAMVLMFTAGLAGGSSFALIPFLNHDISLQARANGAVAQLGNLGATIGPPVFALLISQIGGVGVALAATFCALMGIATASWGAGQYARARQAT